MGIIFELKPKLSAVVGEPYPVIWRNTGSSHQVYDFVDGATIIV